MTIIALKCALCYVFLIICLMKITVVYRNYPTLLHQKHWDISNVAYKNHEILAPILIFNKTLSETQVSLEKRVLKAVKKYLFFFYLGLLLVILTCLLFISTCLSGF